MHNRLTSLFALDELLGPAPTRDAASRSDRSTRRKPAARRKKSRTDEARACAQSFDTGAPIRCEHGLPRHDAGPIQLPADAPPAIAHALDDSYHVEAFEDEAPAEEEEPPLSSRDIEAESEVTLSEASATYREPPAPRYSRARSAPVVSPTSSFSAQMEAVERDLAELAKRTTTPEEVASTPPPESTDEPTTPPEPVARGQGHAVFDAMAKGMNYATEFQLPAVQLSQMFSALDKELDANAARERVPPAPTPTPPTSQLIKDLVDLAPRADAPAEPVPPPAPIISPDVAPTEAR